MRRPLKISLWISGSLVGLVLVLIGAVLITANTESGRAFIARTTSRLTDGHVQLTGIHGSFPAALDLDRLQLSDDQGVWLYAEHISLRWSPWDLLADHVQIDSLHVGLLHMERTPVAKTESKSSNSSFPRSDLTQLTVDTLELGPTLAGAPTSLVVKGSAHWNSLRDTLVKLLAQRTGGLGNYDVQIRLDADRMDATVKLQEPAHGPLENLLQVPGLGDLSVFAQLTGPRNAEHINLTLEAGALHGRTQGTIDLTTLAADLDYAFNATAMTPHPGLSWESVDLQGRWHGSPKSPAADGHLLIKQLHIPGDTELADLNANLYAVGGQLKAHATLTGLVIPGSQPKLFQDAPLTLDAQMNLSDPKRPLELKANHRLFALTGHATTAEPEQTARLELHLPDVEPFAAFAGQKIRGDATLNAQITRDSKSTHLTSDTTANIDAGNASWAGLVRGAPTRLQLTGAMNDAKLTIDRVQLTGKAIDLAASGSAARNPTQDLDLRIELALSDLAKLSPAVIGSLKISGKVTGPSQSLSTVADVTTTLSVHGSPKGTVSASVRADGLPKKPRGSVQAHGDLDGAPLDLDVELERATGDVLNAVVRRADWKSAHIEGEISSGAEVARARGKLRLAMAQLGDLDRLLGSTLRGGVSGDITLTPASRGPSRAKIQLEAHDVVTGGVTANAKLAANGTLNALDIQLDGDSPAVGGLPASITAATQLNTTAQQLHLTALEAKYHGQTLKLLSPATVSFANGLSIAQLKLGAQQAVLALDGSVSPALDLRASLQQVKPDLINAFVPGAVASGTLQASAQLQGTTAAPTGKIHLEFLGVRAANDAALGMPPVDLRADTRLMGDAASVEAKLTAGSSSHLELKGNAPLTAKGALDLKLGGTLDMGQLNPLLEATGKHVSGALNIDTTVTGPTADPDINGTVKLANASMKDYTQGVNLTDITGELIGSHGTLEIRSLTARAAPGNVSITGTIGILQPKMPVDVKLTAKNAQPIASNIITANLDADIHVTGTAREKLDITGTTRINRANIEIPSGFPPDVAVLDVRRPGEAPPPKPETPLVIALKLTVDAPRQILVKGRGLDAELGGELRIHGTTDAPVVGGSFDLQRGTFTLGSSQLTFSTGTVTFNGEGLKNKIDPTLDFVASTQVVDVTATVKITGLADSPKIELSSTPDLPQDEIMARLLFGESAAQLTALQVVEIGAALATLTGGGGGGLNPLAKIQKTLGLDRLTVGSNSNGATSNSSSQQSQGYNVEAGRYVSSRVFVAVKQSTTGTSTLAVDVDLTKHLKLQTRLSDGGAQNQGTTPENDQGTSVGIAYQFEYQ